MGIGSLDFRNYIKLFGVEKSQGALLVYVIGKVKPIASLFHFNVAMKFKSLLLLAAASV